MSFLGRLHTRFTSFRKLFLIYNLNLLCCNLSHSFLFLPVIIPFLKTSKMFVILTCLEFQTLLWVDKGFITALVISLNILECSWVSLNDLKRSDRLKDSNLFFYCPLSYKCYLYHTRVQSWPFQKTDTEKAITAFQPSWNHLLRALPLFYTADQCFS